MTFFLGYPQLLSGDLSMSHLPYIITNKQLTLFPENSKDQIWSQANYYRNYKLNFPFYPFRTLCPRDFNILSSPSSSSSSLSSEFYPTSPIFPGNTQININFKKRNVTNFLPYMLPFKLSQSTGSTHSVLSAEQKKEATKFELESTVGEGADARKVKTTYIVTNVQVQIKSMYLQVGQGMVFFSSGAFCVNM